jgi:hypothetical protein
MLSLAWRGEGAAACGTWQLRQSETGEVVLRFARDGENAARPLGRFAAFAEAMLAQRLYEAAPSCPPCLLPWRLPLAEGAFLLRRDPAGMRLDFRSGRGGVEVARLDAAARRPDARADAALDAAILRRLAELRCARPDAFALEPLTCREALR